MDAISHQRPACITSLLTRLETHRSSGAKAACSQTDKHGRTPLQVAASVGFKDGFAALKAYSDPLVLMPDKRNIADLAKQCNLKFAEELKEMYDLNYTPTDQIDKGKKSVTRP